MIQSTTHQRFHLLLFACICIAVYATAVLFARRLHHLEGAGTVAMGLTIDMVVLVPAAFYFLVVRRRGKPIVSLIPVIVLSIVFASRIVPPVHQQPLQFFEAAAVPLELFLIGWIIRRAGRAARKASRDPSADLLERFRFAAFDVTRNEWAAAAFASETAIFYYALGSWRARPHIPKDSAGFTHHRRSGQAGIVLGLLLLLAVEGIAVHVVLQSWSSIAAWIFTACTLYGALWMIGDYRATVLRPILVTDNYISIRCGLRWTLHVRREQINGIHRAKPEGGKEILNLTFFGTPTHWIELTETVTARGMYGIRRRVRVIGLEPDEPGEFERALSHSSAGE
jgi:hypothetical protein